MLDETYIHDELLHYGVSGMKWGIRRSSSTLRSKASSLLSKNRSLADDIAYMDKKRREYATKSVSKQERNGKYEKRLTKATANKAKFDRKLHKQLKKRNINTDKVGKYMVKSVKYEQKILKAQKKIKYNKYAAKAERMKVDAENARAKIERNEKMIKIYNNTAKALDAGKVQQGRVFMQYVLED